MIMVCALINPTHQLAEHIRRAIDEYLSNKFIIPLISFLLVAASAHADDPKKWTREDTALQTAFSTILIADWTQTLHIARNPKKYNEGNPLVRTFIGKHPSVGKVNAFVGSCLALHTLISYKLDKPYRGYWQLFWIGMESDAVGSNYNMGITVGF